LITSIREDPVFHRPCGVEAPGRCPIEQYRVILEPMGARIDMMPEIRTNITPNKSYTAYNVERSWAEGRVSCANLIRAREKCVTMCEDWLQIMRESNE
jgi:hypothetical protein